MAVGSAFLPWLNITEIILRNQIHHVLCMVHGAQWPWSVGFERTLPSPKKGFNPTEVLQKARSKHSRSQQTGKVVADLSFAFWQHLLKTKYAAPLWNKHLYHAFPNLDKNISVTNNLSRIHFQIEQIRELRNRIAHHEPIYYRCLEDDYQNIQAFLQISRSMDFIEWVRKDFSFEPLNGSYLEFLLRNYPK